MGPAQQEIVVLVIVDPSNLIDFGPGLHLEGDTGAGKILFEDADRRGIKSELLGRKAGNPKAAEILIHIFAVYLIPVPKNKLLHVNGHILVPGNVAALLK
jgi:hypothetical protein